jgi:hypothetical protein
MFVRGHIGLGQIDASGLTASLTDNLPNAYSDTTTLTGLPVVWELGLAGIIGVVVWSLTKRGASAGASAVSSGVKRARRKVARVIQG